MSLVVNGKSDSATYESTVRMLAHIPALLGTKKENALVIGMGTGITAGELTRYPEVRSIDIAEISPSVIKALPLFEKYNFQVHKDPRLKILQGDAFNILKGTDQKWDIIISEPSNPWVTGVDSLFSKEFYTLVDKHLNEDGAFVQWVHFYEASDYKTQTLDNSILHYVAGRVFFMGKLAPIESIFDQKTANFSEDFLLAKKYQSWKNFELHSKVISFLIHGLGPGEYLKPINRHLNLRTYFNKPSSPNLPAKLANDPVLKIIPLITGSSQNQGAWMQVGLQFAPYRVKAEKLFEIVSRTRNWIVPYPLMEGIRTSKDVYEKNWSVFQFCRVLLEEQADMNQVKAVFNLAAKGNNGDVKIRSEDVALLEKIKSKIRHGSGK
jgi:hypothetical protein